MKRIGIFAYSTIALMGAAGCAKYLDLAVGITEWTVTPNNYDSIPYRDELSFDERLAGAFQGNTPKITVLVDGALSLNDVIVANSPSAVTAAAQENRLIRWIAVSEKLRGKTVIACEDAPPTPEESADVLPILLKIIDVLWQGRNLALYALLRDHHAIIVTDASEPRKIDRVIFTIEEPEDCSGI